MGPLPVRVDNRLQWWAVALTGPAPLRISSLDRSRLVYSSAAAEGGLASCRFIGWPDTFLPTYFQARWRISWDDERRGPTRYIFSSFSRRQRPYAILEDLICGLISFENYQQACSALAKRAASDDATLTLPTSFWSGAALYNICLWIA